MLVALCCDCHGDGNAVHAKEIYHDSPRAIMSLSYERFRLFSHRLAPTWRYNNTFKILAHVAEHKLNTVIIRRF